MNIKKIIKELLPIIILIPIKRIVSLFTGMWSGKYNSFEIALSKSTGYNQKIILDQCTKAMLAINDGKYIYERDSVLFDKKEYSFGLATALLLCAKDNNNVLNVLDFGGSLGSTYHQNKDFLKNTTVKWTIIEQEEFVKKGKELFENEILKFEYTIDNYLQNNSKIDIIILSSVLQYLDKPYDWLQKFNKLNAQYIVFDRTPFEFNNNEFITLQKVSSEIYSASYPMWCLSKVNVFNTLDNYEVVNEFESFCDESKIINNKYVNWQGATLKLKSIFNNI